jgi:flagellar hook protein FlgE
MSFFGVPLSGLIASQNALSTVSNNLANLDTVGYKDQSVSFGDIFAQSSSTNGANDPIQTGLGVNLSQTTSNFTDGGTTSTGVSSNMALSGNGFFVTSQPGGAIAYTRAGDFTTNNNGELTTPSGGLVLGYPAVNGVVSTTAPLQPLQLGSGAISPATATTTFTAPNNLNANSAVGTIVPATVQVYDSLGNTHNLTIDFSKSATNQWSYSVNVPTADTGATTTTVASGTMTFDSNGNLTSPTGSISIPIPAFTDGASAMNVKWDLNSLNGGSTITQTAVASGATGTVTQDGSASGTLKSYAVQSDGTVEGTFSNGQTAALGQIAVATFANNQGLQQIGGNLFQVTSGSGAAQINTAGTGGAGTITGGSTENSNVDIATEFSNMIVAQQAYQANAKTITTMDQISQATIQMITQ